MSKLAYDMMKSFIHFFSQLAKERQRIGIQKAKKEGKYKGRKSKFNLQMKKNIEEMMATRKSKNQISKELSISRITLYRYLEKIYPSQKEISIANHQ
jgi:DNA invertase Pin-like site-specific DNA recombinase